MANYSLAEQETVLTFDNESKEWKIYSGVPKHINKLKKLGAVLDILEGTEEKPTAVKATLQDKQISFRNIIQQSAEQKKEKSDRMKKMRQEGKL
jgi:hypothetical protein